MTPADVQRQWSDFLRKASHMPHVLEVAKKTRVGVTPSREVYKHDKMRLLRYDTGAVQQYRTPLIVVFALVNRPYILDLREGKSVVRHFIDRGFDVYNIDWGVPTSGDSHLGMEEYIQGYMDEVVDFVRDHGGSEQVNILGYCMGGSMSAIYTALHPDKVRNLIMLAAPTDWSHKDHLLAVWSDPNVFNVDKLVEAYGNAPAEMLQWSFLLLKPVSTLVEKWVSFYENMENEKFLEDFFAMETWLNDNIPVAGRMFAQFVRHCMQDNQLMEGRLHVGYERVDLRRVTCPVLNLVAENDHLVPCGQSLPFNDAVGSTDKKAVRFPAGHIGLAVGSRSQRELWPQAAQWLAERSERM